MERSQFTNLRIAIDRIDDLFSQGCESYEKFSPEEKAIFENPPLYLALMFRADGWWADETAKIICAAMELE